MIKKWTWYVRAALIGDPAPPNPPQGGTAYIYGMSSQSNGGQAGATTYQTEAPYLANTGVQFWYYDGASLEEFQDINLPASDGDFDNTRNFVYNPGGSQTGPPNNYEDLVGWGFFVEFTYRRSLINGPANTYAIPVWQGGKTIGNWAVGFPMWTQLVAAMTGAKASVDAEGKTWAFQEFDWGQGESDCTATLAPQYQANLIDVRTRIRALSEIPSNAKFVIIKLMRNLGSTFAPYVHIVRGAMNYAAYHDADTYLIEPEDLGCVYQGDNVHYDAASQVLLGQGLNNQTYLTLSAEWQDLFAAGYNGEDAANAIFARYDPTGTYNPVAFATYAALFSGEGDEFRDPTFLTKIKVANTGINQINSERPHQNADNTKWFFRTGTNYQIFSNSGTKIGGTINLNFEGQNPQDSVRWHPINPDILVYIKDDHIIYYDTGASPPGVNPYIAATSPNGNLGSSGRRLWGGDGNIAVKIGDEAWLGISHGGTRTDCQVLVLGDPDNPGANDWKIVSHNWTGSTWELQYETWTTGATKWDFPNGSGFDYASLTLEDEGDGWAYICTVIDGEGTDIYNLSGTKIGDDDSNANHKNEVYYTTGGVNYPAMVKKAVAGTIPPDVNIGDAAIRYREVNITADPMTLTTTTVSPPGLDWGSGYNQAGGGQYSSYATNKSCLLAMNSAVEEGATDWQAYYSEIVEIQLDGDANDDVPRRLLHHMIDTFGSVSGQPEVWYSNDGTHGYFKSDVGGELPGDGYLFWFEIPERTPPSQR